jgi:uncharacterized RDD family membrane protein YckC
LATHLVRDNEPAAAAPTYATFWQRAAAAGIDGLVLHVGWMGVKALPPGEDALWLSILVVPALIWAYEVGAVALWAQTLGKMFVGIRITRTDVGRVGFMRALSREAIAIGLNCAFIFCEFRVIAAVPKEIVHAVPFEYVAMLASRFGPGRKLMVFTGMALAWQLAELVTLLFHPRRRAIHDLIAGTVVIQSRPALAKKSSLNPLRVAAGLVAFVLLPALDMHGARQPYRSYFPNGALKGEYVPSTKGGMKLVVYWENGTIQHIFARSIVQDSKPPRTETTWQSFDESGALTRDREL